MSSLTIEMGLRRRRGNSPPIPGQLACRDDVTLAQKQRLAVLAKMGVGPVAAPQPIRDVPQLPIRELKSGPPPMDRKAALLEKERRFREQEERQQEQEVREEHERREKRSRAMGGISRLGPVMPREDEIPQFLPAPMQVPIPKAETKMEIKISKETAERAKGPQATAEEDEEEEHQAEDQVLAFLRLEKQKKARLLPTVGAGLVPVAQAKALAQSQEDHKPKPGKKKRKRTRGRDGDWEEWHGDDDGDDEDGPDEGWEREHPTIRARDGGVSKQMMVVESVKGKVSTANRNFTDADLERRFSMQESQGHGSLMTEEEVLRMIRKEKQERGGGAQGSASRRVQRELAEWAAAKEQQRARVKSPHRFERMVVSRK